MNEDKAKMLLFEVADVLEEVGIEFFLNYGTCLGAVREKKFIEYDEDLDLGVLIENLVPSLNKIVNQLIRKGISIELLDHRHKAPWDGSIFGLKFYGYGEHGDLIGFMKTKGKRAVPSHANIYWMAHTARFMEELRNIIFYGRIFKVSKDVDGFLTELYGNWRVLSREPYESICKKPESWRKEEA